MNRTFCHRVFARVFSTVLSKGTLITAVMFTGVLLSLLLSGCGTPQKAAAPLDTLPYTGVKPLPADTLPKIRKEDVLKIDTFDIGLILPFYLDSVEEIPDTVEVNYPQESALAIEFYNGVTIALRELAARGLRARLHVYDDANDRARVSSIALMPAFKKMDLLLGPVYNNNLRLMAEYARRDSIILVSPLSPAAGITSDNPFYVMVNPAIEVHCRKIFDYIRTHHRHDNILLFTRPESTEAQYAAVFQNYLNEYQTQTNDYSFSFTQVTFAPDDRQTDADDGIQPFFDVSGKNVVIVPSVDKAYIHNVGRRLYQLIEPPKESKDALRYDITLIGLPVWGDQEGLRLDYLEKLHVHFTSSFHVGSEFYSNDNPFYSSYVEAFNNEPSEYVIKGYDLMMFFGKLLTKYGAAFGKMLCLEQAQGIHTRFSFGIRHAPPASTASLDSLVAPPRIDFIENKYVHLLRYEDYDVKRIDE